MKELKIRVCGSCLSPNCGNYAACARRKEAALKWFDLWMVVGLCGFAEEAVERVLVEMGQPPVRDQERSFGGRMLLTEYRRISMQAAIKELIASVRETTGSYAGVR